MAPEKVDEKIAKYLVGVEKVYASDGAESEYTFELAKGASDGDFEKVRAALGRDLDPWLEVFWHQANGSRGNPVLCDGELLASYSLLSMKDALKERRSFEVRAPQYEGTVQYDRTVESDEPRDKRIGEGWFSPGWLPFASAAAGSMVLLVDHAPQGKGRAGQILRFVHDPDRIEFVASSLGALLPKSLKAIKSDPEEFLCIF